MVTKVKANSTKAWNINPYSLGQQIINLPIGGYYYTREKDSTVQSALALHKMTGQGFKTERVVIVHLKTGESERGTLVTRDEVKPYSKITRETAKRNYRDRSKGKYVARAQRYYIYKDKYIAIDNRTNNFFIEEFNTEEECFNYLNQ